MYWWNSGRGRYDALADPFKVVRIDPADVEYVTGRGPNPGRFQWIDIGTVAGGDWDRSDERYDDLPFYRAVRRHFEDGVPWEETTFVRRVHEAVEEGRVVWRGAESHEEVRAACERIDRLYERIRNEGYRSRAELVDEDAVETGGPIPERLQRRDEVVVDIGRDGDFLFVDGRHRLSIVKVLDLDELPVRVSARHRQWQLHRDAVHAGERDPRTPDDNVHPDLRDLVDQRNE